MPLITELLILPIYHGSGIHVDMAFCFQLFAQIGPVTSEEYLVDITPTWTYTTTGNDAQFAQAHEPNIAKVRRFT